MAASGWAEGLDAVSAAGWAQARAAREEALRGSLRRGAARVEVWVTSETVVVVVSWWGLRGEEPGTWLPVLEGYERALAYVTAGAVVGEYVRVDPRAGDASGVRVLRGTFLGRAVVFRLGEGWRGPRMGRGGVIRCEVRERRVARLGERARLVARLAPRLDPSVRAFMMGLRGGTSLVRKLPLELVAQIAGMARLSDH